MNKSRRPRRFTFELSGLERRIALSTTIAIIDIGFDTNNSLNDADYANTSQFYDFTNAYDSAN